MFQNQSFRKVNSYILMYMLIVVFALALTACGNDDNDQTQETPTPTSTPIAFSPDEVIATYKENGQVTWEQFNSFLKVNKMFNPQMASYFDDPSVQKEALKQYIANLIFTERISDTVKEKADKQIEEQMKQITDYFNGLEGGLDKQLSDYEIELADIEFAMTTSYYSLLSLQDQVTESDVEAEYKKKLDAGEYEIATVSHILIALKDNATDKELRTNDEAVARANEVLAKLNAGEDFAKLAAEYSDDPGSKDNGGTYEDAFIYQWVPEFKKAAQELPLNTISDPPVKTDFGYHIMKVESRSTKALADVKEEIQSVMANAAFGKFMTEELSGYILTNKLEPTPSP